MRVEERVFRSPDASAATGGGFGGKKALAEGPSGYQATIDMSARSGGGSRTERIFQEAAAKNQGLAELRDEMRAQLDQEFARAAESSLNAGGGGGGGGGGNGASPASGPRTTEFGLAVQPGGGGGGGGVTVAAASPSPNTTPGGTVVRYIAG